MIVIADATPLIGFAKLSLLPILRDLFGEVLVPPAVYAEVVTHAPGRPGSNEIRQASWVKVQQPQNQTSIDYLRSDLDSGEAEAIVLAMELAADLVLVDEVKARLAAELLGIRYIGTVGLLMVAKQRGMIGAIAPLLDRLRSERFFISDELYKSILSQIGE